MAMPVPHRSTEPGRPRRRRECAPDTLVDLCTGAQPYVTNYNVAIDGDVKAGRAAAAAVRARFGVQVMALPHADGLVEVGCNLQAGGDRNSPAVGDVLACIESGLPSACNVRKAYVIGLAPNDALARAVDALAREPAERSTFPRTHEACGGPP